jgi:hypothetical protein
MQSYEEKLIASGQRNFDGREKSLDFVKDLLVI